MPDTHRGPMQKNTIKSVRWDSHASTFREGETYLSGTITLTTAPVAKFAFFDIAGIAFSIVRHQGPLDIYFRYSGRFTEAAIQDMVKAGANLLLR